METAIANTRISSLIALYDLHTEYYRRAIDGIKPEDAENRLNTKANHIAWLAGSLVHERYEIAKGFGLNDEHAAIELFKGHKGIQDDVSYPQMSEYRKDWDSISQKLKSALENVTDEKLDSELDMGDQKMKFIELITFMTFREASIIGQIILWRRLLGYSGINYMP